MQQFHCELTAVETNSITLERITYCIRISPICVKALFRNFRRRVCTLVHRPIGLGLFDRLTIIGLHVTVLYYNYQKSLSWI